MKKGLYTDNAGKTVVYVYDVWEIYEDVEFQNVITNKFREMEIEAFEKKYPNRISSIEIIVGDKKPTALKKGLYAAKNKTTVICVYNFSDSYVEFENVRTQNLMDLPLEKFRKEFPHRIDKLEVEFR